MPASEPLREDDLPAIMPGESEGAEGERNPFYDRALKDYLQRTRMSQVGTEQVNAAAERYRSGQITANALEREVLGMAVLIGDHYVTSGEATKQEVLEVASELVISIAEKTEGEDYAVRLAEAMEAHWQEESGIAEVERSLIEPDRDPATDGQMVESRREKAAVRARREHRLVMRYREGNQNAFDELWEQYKGFARFLAKSYFIMGAESDDVVAEAQIGFVKGVRDYKPGYGSFRTFAELTMRRQVITAVKTANRLKHQPLNQRVSFDQPVLSGEEKTTVEDLLLGPESLDPLSILIEREDLEYRTRVLDDAMQRFSALERQVFGHIQQGHTYQEVGDLMGATTKTVDNALQRVKRKFEAAALRTERATFVRKFATRTVESMDMIEQFVAGLSPAEQKVWEAKEAGMDPEEIAIIHGSTEEGVEQLLRSAGRKLEKAPSAEAA